MLNRDQILRLVQEYEDQIHSHFPSAVATRRPDDLMLLSRIEHLLWMIATIRQMLDPNKAVRGQVARSARWLGFIEGSLVQLGLLTQSNMQMMDIRSAIPQ